MVHIQMQKEIQRSEDWDCSTKEFLFLYPSTLGPIKRKAQVNEKAAPICNIGPKYNSAQAL